MCTCCTSPLAVGLRKRGASSTAALAYWVGNPLLNPAVLAFLFLVAPWQFGAVRIIAGAAVLACAVLGTLLVIPTGGEIPVILALTAAGAGAGTAGALLITLPAISLPSMIMVGRAMSWQITLAMAAVVAVADLLGGLLLWLLT